MSSIEKMINMVKMVRDCQLAMAEDNYDFKLKMLEGYDSKELREEARIKFEKEKEEIEERYKKDLAAIQNRFR